jgi:aminoglycoside phosphotransferase (APT) family kinase protein
MTAAAPTGIDLPSFTRWAASALPDATPPFDAEVIAGGRSNITVRVRDARGWAFVVRRPPLHSVLPTAHDMGREHRIISALGPTAVPVPAAFASCDDPDVIGAPFYVMSFVEGVVVHDQATARTALDPAARAHAGASVVDALVELHAVDIDAVGLGDLARRDELVARQLKRWHRQVEASKTRPVPAIDRVHQVLAARIPPQSESTVVHGDFRLGNCIVGDDGEVRAVLDWEICTLGDPRADVGYLLASWSEPGDVRIADPESPTLVPGFLTRDELLERYAARSARNVEDMPYFVVFSLWRLACILEGVLARELSGARGEDDVAIDGIRQRADISAALAEEYAADL